MPLSDQQKQQIVTLSGLDPSSYTTDDEGIHLIPIQQASTPAPTFGVPQTVVSVKPVSPTPTESFVKSAIHAAPSAALGGIGAGIATSEANPLAHIAPPYSEIGAGLIGALAGGGVGRWLQSQLEDQFVPEQQQQEFAQGQQANPWASRLGAIAATPLGGFNPNPKNVLSAAGAIPKLLTGMPTTAAEGINLANVGVGAGLGGGVNLGEQMVGNKPFDLSQLLEAVGTGALFNKPNAIGQNIMGFHNPEPNDIVTQLQGEMQQAPQVNPLPSTAPSFDALSAGGTPLMRGAKTVKRGEGEVIKSAGDALSRFKQNPQPDVTAFENEGGAIPVDQSELVKEQQLQKDREQKIADFQKAKDELAQQNLELSTKDLQDQIEANKLKLQEKRVAPLATTELGKDIMPDYTGVTEQNNAEAKAESPNDLAMRRAEGLTGDKYSEQSALTPEQLAARTPDQIEADRIAARNAKLNEATAAANKQTAQAKKSLPATKVQQQYLESNNPKVATRRWYDIIKRWAGDVKGINIDSSGEVLNDKGQSVAGVTLLKDNLPEAIKTNPFKRGADTEPHELFHAFINTLRNSTRPADQRIVRQYEDTISKEPDYIKWKAARDQAGLDSTPEEYAANNAGYEFIQRVVNSRKESPFKTYLNDFASYLKTRFGKHADLEDYQRLLNYRLSYGKEKIGPSASLPSSIVNTPNWTDTKQQEESQLSSEDFDTLFPQAKSSAIPFSLDKDSAFEPVLQPKSSPSKDAIYALTNDRGQKDFANLQQTNPELAERLKYTSVKEPVYHKTGHTFDRANPDVAQQAGHSSLFGMHVGTVKAANERSASNTSNIHKMYLDMRNPYEVSDTESNLLGSMGAKMLRDGLLSQTEYDNIVGKNYGQSKAKQIQAAKALQDVIKRSGYDGLKYENQMEDAGKPSYVVFDKSQLVNAISQKRDPVTGELYSDESKLPNEDKKRYEEIQARMHQLIDNKQLGEEFTNLWKESEAIKNRNKGMPPVDEKASNYSLLNIFKPQLENIKDKYGPEGEALSDAAKRYFPKKDEVYGKGMYPILEASKGLSRGDLKRVEDVLIRENADKQYYNNILTPKQKSLYDSIKQSLLQKQQDQIAANQPITMVNGGKRLPQIDPYYFPNRINPEVADILNDPTQRAKANQLKQDFINYQIAHGLNRVQAEAKLKGIETAYEHGTINLAKFNANREAQGVGLPDSWMRRGKLLENLSGYYNRVAADRAYHDTIETNSDVAHSIGIHNDPWGNPITSNSQDIAGAQEVKDLMEKLHGEAFDKTDRELKTSNKIATALMLGPLTNVHIAASSIFNGMQHTSPRYTVQAMVHGLTHLSDGLQHALQTGYARKDLSSFSDILNGNNTSLEKMAALANGIGKLSGRELTNNMTKGFLQSWGEYVLKQKQIEANNGNTGSQKLMKQIDPDWIPGKTYSPTEFNKTASTFASFVHGAHDTRTMPGWMLKETAIQPFLQLASWNIAQTNQWMKHVWTPAKSGNFEPLIMSTLGAGIGGYIIKELREKLADKKAPIPSLAELVASDRGLEGNIPNVAYNLMAMTSYVGYGGMLSVMAKSLMDVTHKNIPQAATFPLDEVISNSATRIGQAIGALTSDESPDYFQTGIKLVTDLARENIQLARLGTTWLAHAGVNEPLENQLKLNEKLSDLRRFKMAEGLPYESQTGIVGNPYQDLGEKQFKKTTDISEAAGELPNLISEALAKSKGNIEVLRSELQKIKTNSYQTMPNPKDTPIEFYRYIRFLNETQPDEATNRLVDYFSHNAINKIKSDLVPSI